MSLLDAAKEIALRSRLPKGVRMYTGDDFNFAALIGGDATGHSDALLGIFDAIAPAASAALTALAAATRPFRRHPRAHRAAVAPIFAAPTRFYKTGVVFLAWLNGHQSHFTMVGGQQSARSCPSRRGIPARRCRGPAARPRSRRIANARVPARARHRRLTSRRNAP